MTPIKALHEFVPGAKIGKDSRRLIDSKMKSIERKFPYLCLVRLRNKSRDFNKKSDTNFWSTILYQVRGYKRPVFETDNVGLYLRKYDQKSNVEGVFYPFELKLVL